MDLIITVDHLVAHLAGALNIDTTLCCLVSPIGDGILISEIQVFGTKV